MIAAIYGGADLLSPVGRLEVRIQNYDILEDLYEKFLEDEGILKVKMDFEKSGTFLPIANEIHINGSMDIDLQILTLLHELVHWNQGLIIMEYKNPYTRYMLELEAFTTVAMFAHTHYLINAFEGGIVGPSFFESCEGDLTKYVKNVYLGTD